MVLPSLLCPETAFLVWGTGLRVTSSHGSGAPLPLALVCTGKRRPSNGPFPKPAFTRVFYVPLCNPLWVTKLLAYLVHPLCPAHSIGKESMGSQPQQKSTKGRCCHEHRFAPKQDLQLDQNFLLQTSPRAELRVMQRWKRMAPSPMPSPPEEAKLFNYYLFHNYFLWRLLQGSFKPPLPAGGDKVMTILDTVKISTVISILVPQE